MIQATELFPKNLVYSRGKRLIEVTSSSHGTFEPSIIVGIEYLSESEIEFHYDNPEQLEPVPVDETWIKRFGCQGVIVNGFHVKKSEYGGYAFCLLINPEENESVELCRINGVHHLQNLFLVNAGHIIKDTQRP
jgi:hypothetical protein